MRTLRRRTAGPLDAQRGRGAVRREAPPSLRLSEAHTTEHGSADVFTCIDCGNEFTLPARREGRLPTGVR